MARTKKQGREARPKGMPEALRKKCAEVQKLLKQEFITLANIRFGIGVIVLQIQDDPSTYGTAAVAALARDSGLNKGTLYEYAQVARRWPKAEFAELLKKKSAGGKALSWSHLVELAKEEDDQKRADLMKAALEQNLSVRQTKRYAEEANGTSRSQPQDARETEEVDRSGPQDTEEANGSGRIELPVVESRPADMQAEKGLRSLVAYAEYFAQESASWDTDIKLPIQTMMAEQNNRLPALLSEAIDVIRPSAEALSALLKFLEEAHANVTPQETTKREQTSASRSRGKKAKANTDAA